MAEEQQEDTVNVMSPLGKVGSLPKSQLNDALDSGYSLPSGEQVRSAKNEEQYGGVQGSIFSATLGAARTATLGGSDLALSALPEGVGFSPEELKGFSETNPVSSTVGEVAGILRDPLALGKGISAAGKATTSGATKALKAMGMAEDASAVTKTLAGSLGLAVEGGLFGGVANTVDDYALGDPSLNGEKILSNIGYGAFLGGGIGTTFKVLGYGVTPAIRKAVGALANIRDELIGSGYGEKDAIIHKILPNRFAEAITDRQLNLDTKGQASTLRKITTNLNQVTGSVTDEIKSFGEEINPRAVSSLFKASSKVASEAQQKVGEYLSSAIEQIKAVVSDDKTKDLLDSIRIKMKMDSFKGGAAEAIFNGLKQLKGHIGELSSKEPMIGEALDPIQKTISDAIKDPGIFGPAGAAQAIHEENVSSLNKFISPDSKNLTPFQQTFGEVKNGKWQFDITKLGEALGDKDYNSRSLKMSELSDFFDTLKEMPENMLSARRAVPNSKWKSGTLKQIIETSQKSHEEAFQDYLDGIKKRRPLYGWKDYAPVLIAKWHPVIAAALEAYDFYQDPVHATHGLSTVERLIGQTTQKSLDLIDSIFEPSTALKEGLEIKGHLLDKGSDKEDEHEKFKHYARDPDMVASAIEKSTKDLHDVAPNIAQQLHVIANNATSFLSSKLPATNDHLSPFGTPSPPSETDLAKFENYRKVVENPLISLEQVKNRTISPETIETLSVVYPKLYQQLKESTLKAAYAAKTKEKIIPYQTKQALSMFLGEPIDHALQPQSILSNQALFASSPKPNQMGEGKEKPRAKGLDKINRSQRSQNEYSILDHVQSRK